MYKRVHSPRSRQFKPKSSILQQDNMVRTILSTGFPIAFVFVFLAFEGLLAQRSPKIQPSMLTLPSTNSTKGPEPQPKGLLDRFGVNGGTGANGGISRPLWGNSGANSGISRPLFGNGGANGGAGLGNNVLGQAAAGFGGAVGAGVGGMVGSAANLLFSPLAGIGPLFGGSNTNIRPPTSPAVYPSPVYQPPSSVPAVPPHTHTVPYYPFSQPTTTNNVGMVGWGSYGQNTGTITYSQCNTLWGNALLKEATNYDDWRCSARLLSSGTTQPCVLTGAIGNSTTPSVITTGCGWTMPLFCDDSINDIVYGLRATIPMPAPTPPTGYTYVAGVGTYKVNTTPKTWAEAKATCELEGAHLAVPSTATDYSTIQTQLNTAIPTNNGAWVGISDIAVENYFQTVSGQPTCTLGQVLFATGEPNNGGVAGPVENCIQFGQGQNGLLNDMPCGTLLPFVCEITLPARLATCRVYN